MLSNSGAGKPWVFFEQQGDPTSPSERKSVLNIRWKVWCWSFNTLAYSLEKILMLEKIEGREERGNRGWAGWMASPTGSMDMSLSKLLEIVKNREAWCAAVHLDCRESDMSDWTIPISPFSWIALLPSPTPLGCHKAPSWAPWVIEQLPISCFTYDSVCVSMLCFQFVSPFPSPSASTVCSLCLHILLNLKNIQFRSFSP